MSTYDKTVGIVGSSHEESLRAMDHFRTLEHASFRLYGNRQETAAIADRLGIDLDDVLFIPTEDPHESCIQAAHDAQEGHVHALMKGSVHTAEFLRSLLDRNLGLLPEGALLSHVAHL